MAKTLRVRIFVLDGMTGEDTVAGTITLKAGKRLRLQPDSRLLRGLLKIHLWPRVDVRTNPEGFMRNLYKTLRGAAVRASQAEEVDE